MSVLLGIGDFKASRPFCYQTVWCVHSVQRGPVIFDVFVLWKRLLLVLNGRSLENSIDLFAVGIIKPNSSRPANSERYLVCNNYHVNETTQAVKEYLRKVVDKLWELREEKERDIVEIVPQDILINDKDFFGYIHESNTRYSLKSQRKH